MQPLDKEKAECLDTTDCVLTRHWSPRSQQLSSIREFLGFNTVSSPNDRQTIFKLHNKFCRRFILKRNKIYAEQKVSNLPLSSSNRRNPSVQCSPFARGRTPLSVLTNSARQRTPLGVQPLKGTQGSISL